MCSLFARFGGLLSPYVILLASTWKPLPLLVFGLISIVAAALTTVLPETHKKKLPATLEEAEAFGQEAGDEDELETLNTA